VLINIYVVLQELLVPEIPLQIYLHLLQSLISWGVSLHFFHVNIIVTNISIYLLGSNLQQTAVVEQHGLLFPSDS